jgi:hypothetical protein
MIEIAGLLFTAISTLKDLFDLKKDTSGWKEDDLPVDRDWYARAVEKGLLNDGEYGWSAEDSVATRELLGTHTLAIAYNEEKRLKCRIVRGHGRRLVLMKRIAKS